MQDFLDLTTSRLVRLAARPSCWWLCLACVCLALLAPLLLVDVPPLLDYPNHLARAYLLAFGAQDPVLSRMAEAHWAIIPNLAIDIVLPPLMKLVPVHVAGRLLLGVILVLPVLGCAALARAVMGRRTYWSLASGLVACNELFLLGFMNFELSAGLALIFAAIWAMWRERRPMATTLIGIVAAGILFACHLMGLLFYFILIAAIESPALWRALRNGRSVTSALARVAVRVLPILPLPLMLYAISGLGHEPASIGWWSIDYKIVHLATFFVNYRGELDAFTTFGFVAFIVVCIVTGRMRLAFAGGMSLAVLAVLYLVSPFNFKGTSFLDVRFVVMFGFVMFALAAPRLPARAACLAAASVIAVFSARMLVVAETWHAHASDLAELRAAMAPLRPGDRVLLATVADTDAPDHWRDAPGQTLSDGTRVDLHLGGLALIERHAFWPFLFADPTQQPIRLLPPYDALAAATRSIPSVRQLVGPSPEDMATFPLGSRWACCYDHVLLLRAGALPGFADPRLTPLVAGGFASLYQVRQSGPTVARLAPLGGTRYVPVVEQWTGETTCR